MRRPTPTERDNAAAWLDYNARVQAQANAMLRVLLAVVLAVLGALALVHWATPCPDATLCLSPLAMQRNAPRRLAAWWRRRCRRLQMRVLHVRLHQLLGAAHELALDTGPTPHAGVSRQLGAVLDRAAALRLRLAHLQQADAQDQRLQRLQA